MTLFEHTGGGYTETEVASSSELANLDKLRLARLMAFKLDFLAADPERVLEALRIQFNIVLKLRADEEGRSPESTEEFCINAERVLSTPLPPESEFGGWPVNMTGTEKLRPEELKKRRLQGWSLDNTEPEVRMPS